MTRPMGEMDDSLFHKIIKDGKEIRASLFAPCLNGEPFVFPRIWEWLDYMEKEKVSVGLYTNAELMDVDRLIRYNNIRYVHCSFNGATEETYNKVMRGPKFEIAKNNIKELIKRAKFKTMVLFIEVEENTHEVELFRKMWGKSLIRGRFINYAGARHSKLEKQGDKKPCYSILNKMAILWDGRVVPCCMDYNGSQIVGDVNTQSLADIWHNTYWMRKKHRNLEFDIPLCKDCNYNLKI